jgi:hypothetical protein
MQGPDTAGLSFRVGLHSGPVTGGVLRGDNARFQLFGDVCGHLPCSVRLISFPFDLLIFALLL